VRVPSLPEIVTYGKDEREALAMAEDAIRLVLEDCAARGEPVPAGESRVSARSPSPIGCTAATEAANLQL
jgi:predicted RNase H-like HicB family nuclease